MALLMSSSATMAYAAEHVRRFPAPDLHDDRLGHSARPQVPGSRALQIMDEKLRHLGRRRRTLPFPPHKFVASNTGAPDLRKCFLKSATSSLVSASVRGLAVLANLHRDMQHPTVRAHHVPRNLCRHADSGSGRI
jgi:hypothetical protein